MRLKYKNCLAVALCYKTDRRTVPEIPRSPPFSSRIGILAKLSLSIKGQRQWK